MDGVNDCLKGINKEASNAQAYEELKDRFVVRILMYFSHISVLFDYKIRDNKSSSPLDRYWNCNFF